VIEKVVSGGQTGVDRAALDVALELGLETGGWIPRGRRAEDGRVPDSYRGLIESDAEAYETRTELNVRDSDATLILTQGPAEGGTALTARVAARLRKPRLVVDLAEATPEECAGRVREWLASSRPRVLNVAGPRASEAPGIGEAAGKLMRLALRADPA
jgi:hypothetical protein